MEDSETSSTSTDYARLNKTDIYWRDLYPWLKETGYELRPRFRPGWVPSWQLDGEFPLLKEDYWGLLRRQVIDAVRIADGVNVYLKSIKDEQHPFEIEITNFLCSEPLRSDPKNHCLPLLGILNPPALPGTRILVFKLLRKFDQPHFDTIGEAVEFFRQIFEGLQFMHKNQVAHRDCSTMNIMMDGAHLYPHGFHPYFQSKTPDYKQHPKHLTRTQAPVKYYLIDVGISIHFDPGDEHYALPIIGADRSVPEYQGDGPMSPTDPFATDVYLLGNLIRSQFIDGQYDMKYYMHPGREGFGFMRGLVTDMVKHNPAERPKIDEVVDRFDVIVKGLSTWKLRSRARGKEEYTILSIGRIFRHWYRRIGFMLRGVPALPTPK
ncbi:hypothetical protein B0H15DRAFT_835013 [Mycena belliarum]|uniref:Protein kinase domain-containing protein n=1 Tax=Mycena belliarum TaxID=1033014 RepID=A0AAD6U5S4_9AGAR|nr:hypothetical protein B0H15DRAFT_835013 [Mycena belliae]